MDSARERRVEGGEGRYLYISFNGWPEFTRRVRATDELAGFEPVAIRRYVGLVSQVKVEKDETAPNMARGKGC